MLIPLEIEGYFTPEFWTSVLKIIGIDILLSGDNAVVIALACRGLPPKQQKLGVFLGAGAAIVLRVIFAVFIVYLLDVPWLKLIGGLLLFWIAFKLVSPEAHSSSSESHVQSAGNLWQAVRTIVIADAVMSLDNVVAIAAAAHGRVDLLVFGLLVSIPLIVFGSTMILKVLERYPLLIIAGGALLGYVAAEVMIDDPVLKPWVAEHLHSLHHFLPYLGAVLVFLAGIYLARRQRSHPIASKIDPSHE